MSSFTITSQRGAKCIFHSRTYEPNGWLDAYTVDLEDLDFRASARVANPGFGFPPSLLFNRLALQWRGWPGNEVWKSVEGEFAIVATCDRTGHAKLVFEFPTPAQGACWSASAFVCVEAGQLDSIAYEAHQFFDAGSMGDGAAGAEFASMKAADGGHRIVA
jgi:hypothetical protein